MIPKSNLNHNKIYLVLFQMGILFIAMAFLFWFMVLNNKERIVNDLLSRVDTAAQTMAAQLKASQVPFSTSSVEPGVLIINQGDGSVVIDRRNGNEHHQKLWERYKTKIIYEMQKQKRGWIEYPDKNTWTINEPRRVIRYLSIDELNWILAIEELKPSPLDLLKEAVAPSTVFLILIVFIFGSVAIWFVNENFFDRIKRQISDNLEDNLLSLNGEEKLWSKAHGHIPKMNEENKDIAVEFSPPKVNPVPQVADDPIMEEVFHKTPAPKNTKPIINHIDQSLKASSEVPPVKAVDKNDLTLNVQNIKSSVLKKMLQQFREK